MPEIQGMQAENEFKTTEMAANEKTFLLSDEQANSFLARTLCFSKNFDIFSVLTSNGFYKDKDLKQKPYYHDFDLLAGFGAFRFLKTKPGMAFENLKIFHSDVKDWLFGYLAYDLKNEVEKLSSNNSDYIGLPDLYFFQPQIIITLKENTLFIKSNSPDKTPDEIFEEIINSEEIQAANKDFQGELKTRFNREEYIEVVEKLRQHIIEGDVYEINFCQEYFAENAETEPTSLFKKLVEVSPNPFACFLKIEDKFVISSSMERFLKKKGQKLISQPIKGTIKKSANPDEDLQLQQQLFNDEKERAENVMIVDLVRNDLARSAKTGTVKVEELFGIYPFTHLHQMISTVTADLKEEIHWADAIKRAFPMGSMTGAPKVMAMELIEKYERTKRGVYSGAVGYITPEGDFDLNVIIRTFIYNSISKYLSLQVGSAITYDSVPEKEYEECLVKIAGLKKSLGITN